VDEPGAVIDPFDPVARPGSLIPELVLPDRGRAWLAGSAHAPAADGPSVDMVHFMVKNLSMIRINIHEAKAKLSKYLQRLRKGEVIIICKRNVPVAELRGLARERGGPRKVGFLRGEFTVPESFFEPLPSGVLEAFEGIRGDGPPAQGSTP
jgi:prevent-host-death family protein